MWGRYACTELRRSLRAQLPSSLHAFASLGALGALSFGCLWGLHYRGVLDGITGQRQLIPPPTPLVSLGAQKFQPFNPRVVSPGDQPPHLGGGPKVTSLT